MNVLQYAAQEEATIKKALSEMSGYEMFTTFYSDLSIAEWYGGFNGNFEAVKDTYDNVMNSWMEDIKYITEFALCLNWKSWEMAERGLDDLGEYYTKLYYEAYDKVVEHYDGDDESLSYFFRTLD